MSNCVNLFPFSENDKEGYINATGKIVIEPQFDIAAEFYDGVARVAMIDPSRTLDPLTNMIRLNNGFIGADGALIADFQYPHVRDFSDQRAAVRVGKKVGYLDTAGEMVIEPRFDFAWSCSEGLAPAIVRKNKPMMLSKDGEVAFEKPAGQLGDCREGLIPYNYKSKWSYLDRDGETAFELKCSAASPFSEGLAAILAKGKMGYIDTSGNIVIEPQFPQAQEFSEGLAAVEVYNAGKGKKDYTKPQQFIYIDQEGNRAIETTFLFAGSFSEGLAAVNLDERGVSAYINKLGEVVIPPIKCDLALPFRNGLARIQFVGDRYGYINREGEFVWSNRK